MWKVKVKWSRYRPGVAQRVGRGTALLLQAGVAQRVGRGIALLFHDRDTRRGWVVSSTPRSHFTPGKDPVPILQEARWVPGPAWTGGKSRPYRDSIPDRPARSQSLYRLSYRAHTLCIIVLSSTDVIKYIIKSWVPTSRKHIANTGMCRKIIIDRKYTVRPKFSVSYVLNRVVYTGVLISP